MPFLIALGLALILTPLAVGAGMRTGLVDRPGGALKIHARPVSVLGGLAVVAAALLGATITGHAPGWGLLVAVLLLACLGLLDDVRGAGLLLILMAQLGAGVLLAADGARLEPLGPLAAAGVVLLVPACANGVNIIDGQDALAGGLAAIAALGLVAIAGGLGAPPIAVALALAGALVGFLAWNRPPARIFLGNSGPPAIGVVLAAAAASASASDGWPGLLGAALCLGVFAFEVCSTLVRRVGSKLATGDRLHSYDLLAARMGRGQVTLVFWACGAALAGAGVAVGTVPPAVGALAIALAAAAAVLVGRGLWAGRAELD